jgi:hypothetical protein
VDYSLGVSLRNDAYYTGKIDEVRIYNRSISDAEVIALYLAPN